MTDGKTANGDGGNDDDVYRVGVGGSPPDTWDEYDTLAKAQEAALSMARDMASQISRDPEDIDLYDGSDDEGDEGGACPSNDTGGYWPAIHRETRA